MNWITDYLKRPKIKEANVSENNTADLWKKCPKCDKAEFYKNWSNNFQICPNCEYYMPLTIEQRLENILDEGYVLEVAPKVKSDPLNFVDRKKYSDRVKEANRAGLNEAIAVVSGEIDGYPVVAAVMDFAFIGGSMGMFVGESIRQACQLAISRGVPFICFTASGGARMQEGIYSLMQMPRTTLAVETLKQHGLPFIVCLTNPTMGGVLASFAMLGDITIAEPGATIGFSGRRVVENTVREQLPGNFQTSQFQYDCGFVDQIIPRPDLKGKLGGLLKLLRKVA